MNSWRSLCNNPKVASVQVQLYSPRRPSLDPAEVFLWLMAAGTIVCASYWSAWSVRESDIELDKLLKDASDYVDTEEKGSSDTVDIGITLILLFIVTASCFLVVLYKFMSNLFVEVLVVLFSIGGVQGLQTCLVALLYWWFRNAGDSYIRVPFIGTVSHLTLAVSPFCLAFASVWVVYRNICFAWIGQDILGMSLMISVFQIVRVPNLKVARGHRSGGIPMLLKFRRMLDHWGGYSIVGFGDILLPGLVLAFSLRSDWLCQKNLRAGYFLWAVMAYGLGPGVSKGLNAIRTTNWWFDFCLVVGLCWFCMLRIAGRFCTCRSLLILWSFNHLSLFNWWCCRKDLLQIGGGHGLIGSSLLVLNDGRSSWTESSEIDLNQHQNWRSNCLQGR